MLTKKRATKRKATKKKTLSKKSDSRVCEVEEEIKLAEERLATANRLAQKRIRNLYLKKKEIERGRPLRNFRFQLPAIDIVLDEEQVWGGENNEFDVNDIQEMIKEGYGPASSLIDEWSLIDYKENKFKITEVK